MFVIAWAVAGLAGKQENGFGIGGHRGCGDCKQADGQNAIHEGFTIGGHDGIEAPGLIFEDEVGYNRDYPKFRTVCQPYFSHNGWMRLIGSR